MQHLLTRSFVLRIGQVRISCLTQNVRFFKQTQLLRGGYIEEAQLAIYGAEIFKDIHGHQDIPKGFKVSQDDDRYPELLRGFDLGAKVIQYKVLDPPQPLKNNKTELKPQET